MNNLEDVVNALCRQGTLHHGQLKSLKILMAKKAESIELHLRKNGDSEGGGQVLEKLSLFSNIMPGCAPCKPINNLTEAGTCNSSTLKVNSEGNCDYFSLLVIAHSNGYQRSKRAER